MLVKSGVIIFLIWFTGWFDRAQQMGYLNGAGRVLVSQIVRRKQLQQ